MSKNKLDINLLFNISISYPREEAIEKIAQIINENLDSEQMEDFIQNIVPKDKIDALLKLLILLKKETL